MPYCSGHCASQTISITIHLDLPEDAIQKAHNLDLLDFTRKTAMPTSELSRHHSKSISMEIAIAS